MENYIAKEMNGILVKNKANKDMMNLHCKTFLELNKDELQREIDYLWGQYDYVSQSEDLPEDIQVKQAKYLWSKINLFTSRYVSMVCSYVDDLQKGWDK